MKSHLRFSPSRTHDRKFQKTKMITYGLYIDKGYNDTSCLSPIKNTGRNSNKRQCKV
jgi:hypothetical protein